MASSQAEIDQKLSRLLIQEAETTGVFAHPTAKGDGREDIIRKKVEQRVGTTFGVTKAEVIDSMGHSSSEHDFVIYDQSTSSCLHDMLNRRVIRVESLAVTTEVKTELDAKSAETTSRSLCDGFFN